MWEFWIDRGGTFTDCIGVAPDGSLHTEKLLSSDEAPIQGIRTLLERNAVIGAGEPLPRCRVRLGTTVATNALLERRGAPTLLVTNHGLGDLLAIGNQQRPDLFALHIEKPPPIQTRVAEVAGRVGAHGEEIEPFDEAVAREALRAARDAGIDSAAIALVHAYAHPEFELRLRVLAEELGFGHVSLSHEVAREMGLLARAETTAVDAYLTPLLQGHVVKLGEALPGSQLRFMQSSGGLTEAARFKGPTALLSGPAGGVVGAAEVASAAGYTRAVGFDMGGTSTDVSLIESGEVERTFETEVGGVRVKAPMLRIHTVAAGGGSLCRFDGIGLTVGPESAGASPGPLCYGNPEARELALTDVNFALGRVQPDRFPFALERAPVEAMLARLERELAAAGFDLAGDALAAGFVEVANASMASAIAEVSLGRGVDVRDCALVGFGGAAGQHVCAIARELGMRDILLHPLAGVLSAYGIGVAPVSWDGQHDAGRVPLPPDGETLPAEVRERLAALAERGRAALEGEGVPAAEMRSDALLDLRYAGTETALTVREPAEGRWQAAFLAAHRARFGYTREGRAVEIVTARVRASSARSGERARAAASGMGEAAPLREEAVWFPERGRLQVPVYARERLGLGAALEGPALILEGTGSVVLDPGFRARVDDAGVMHLQDSGAAPRASEVDLSRADPIRLEVFGNRIMSIAERMGAVLRNTSVSTNIKERLDYSCAVFDAEGGLVANAPHIPVHLGAMGETVRAVLQRFPELEDGEVIVTNDPNEGGSHLPDVTTVTPVFPTGAAEPSFFVASRGHHADIGGITPGSMPAASHCLEEEGVLLRPFHLVRRGRFDEKGLRRVLGSARYPARNPDDNVADLEAMVAANRCGVGLLQDLAAEHGLAVVRTTMRQLQEAASSKVEREIGRLPDGEHVFEDALDDGTPVRVAIVISGARMRVDFSGTGAAVADNLNAPRAVVQAAVIYVVRTLVAERIPLNDGCLGPVEIVIPEGCLLDPPPDAAVVGGNVETSQRVVDVLLGALGVAAASQGTMNNVTFGDESFGYYETIGGGAGAVPGFDGASGVHTHMTNTRITDPEVLEARHQVRILEFSLRRGSGGAGRWRGGDGLVRRYQFTAPVTVSLLTQRRSCAPFGLAGGSAGAPGRNRVERGDGRVEELPGKATVALEAGESLCIETPGGGGYGSAD